MPRKPLTNPRKYASQQRSRVTVDALVEATARILVKDGIDKASTNRIAEKAGMSVGSLYQYLMFFATVRCDGVSGSPNPDTPCFTSRTQRKTHRTVKRLKPFHRAIGIDLDLWRR